VGCFATFVLTVGSGRMTLAKIRKAAYSTLEISSMILLLVTASNLFGAVFSRLGSADFLAQMLTSLALPPMLMLIVILALIFVLGWPLEWVPIVLIVVPIVLPIVQAAGIDLIWFCTLVAVTLQTAWLSPPVALSAYFLKGVVPQWDMKDIYAGMVQFMVLQLLAVGLLLIFPKLATWLPSLN
jgi:TRAP-type mannitol/chloroaromatic compound transport system permease large subunit